MGRIVIACYRPRPGQQDALRALVGKHVPTLRTLGLVTERRPVTMAAGDGTIVEVFEWASAEAVQTAHGHPTVLQMWQEFAQVAEYVPIAQVPEATRLFSEFTPLD